MQRSTNRTENEPEIPTIGTIFVGQRHCLCGDRLLRTIEGEWYRLVLELRGGARIGDPEGVESIRAEYVPRASFMDSIAVTIKKEGGTRVSVHDQTYLISETGGAVAVTICRE